MKEKCTIKPFTTPDGHDLIEVKFTVSRGKFLALKNALRHYTDTQATAVGSDLEVLFQRANADLEAKAR